MDETTTYLVADATRLVGDILIILDKMQYDLTMTNIETAVESLGSSYVVTLHPILKQLSENLKSAQVITLLTSLMTTTQKEDLTP